MVYPNKIVSLCLFSALMLLLLSAPGCRKHELRLPQLQDTLSVPYQEINTSTIFCYSGSKLVWKLISNYSYKTMEDTSSMLVVPVKLSIFDTLTKKKTRVLSDSGTTNKDLQRFFLWGNVYIKNWDGLIIKSRSLWWDKATRKIGSDDFVKIKTPKGDILKGKGLDATETFSEWTLLDSVKGEFPNFNDRMESDALF